MLDLIFTMATQSLPISPQLPALGRYFETSLYLLLLVSVLTLVSTGKLDLAAILLPPAALLLKGYRWWRGRAPELSHRTATVLVVLYFFFFPVDLWWFSSLLANGAQNPGLYSALLAAVHLMLFAMIVRLFSASTTRDYLFLAMLAFSSMLASAILTVDTAFLIFFLVFLALCVSTFIGLEMRRSAEGATSAPAETGSRQARRLHTALGITSGTIAVSALLVGTCIFFLLPRFSAGYLSGFNLQPSLISGFTDDVELGQIGEIKLSNALVMRVKVEGGPAEARDVHWRGIVLTTFDGRRWRSDAHEAVAVTQDLGGWIPVDATGDTRNEFSVPLHYSVFLEPMATDAIFVAAEPESVRGEFMGEAAGRRGARGAFVARDKTGSLIESISQFLACPVRRNLQHAAPDSETGRGLAPRSHAISPGVHGFIPAITASRFAYSRARPADRRARTHSLRQGACDGNLFALALRLHARSFGNAAGRSARLFSVRKARRPLRVLRGGHDGDDAQPGSARALRERLPAGRIQRSGRRLHRSRTRRA